MTLRETKLNGLVLAGGKSTRMGYDKSTIDWQGKEQRYFVADILQEFCDDVYISCRDEEQAKGIDNNYRTIIDNVDGKGPIVGILSALSNDNNSAWLVVACDLPLVDAATIKELVNQRDTNKIATTYKSPHDGLPEPLITIWEASSIVALNDFKTHGYNCPRKVLINSDVKIITPENPKALLNANTPEDAEIVKSILVNNTTRTV